MTDLAEMRHRRARARRLMALKVVGALAYLFLLLVAGLVLVGWL